MEPRDLRAIPTRGDPAVCCVAAAVVTAAVVGAGATMIATSNAADAQVSAADSANNRLQQQYQQTRQDLIPYNIEGQGAAGALAFGLGLPGANGSGGGSGTPGNVDWDAFAAANPDVAAWAQNGGGDPNVPIGQQSLAQRYAYWYQNANKLGDPRGSAPLPTLSGSSSGGSSGGTYGGMGFGDLSAPVTMDQATLEKTPGYQFTLSQGLKATQNAASARGLGVSGAALKGAASYATGLADNTYQHQFENAVTNHTNTFNRLLGLAKLGENAGAQTGTIDSTISQAQAGNITGAGNAIAAGNVAAGNAISGAAGTIGNYYMMNSLMNNGGGGGGGGMYDFAPGT